MITCTPKGDPQTSAIVRGCVILIVAACVFLVLVCICAAIPGVRAAPVEQATATPTLVVCAPVGQAVLSTPFSSVNIRPSPIAQGTPLGAVNDRTPRPIQSTRVGWIGLCPAGWVAAQYFTVIVFTPTVAPTRVVQATPTRIEPQRMYCRAGSVTVTPVAPGRELVMCEEWTP